MSSAVQLNYRDTLRRAFADRCARNASYSLRAFARDLGMMPSRLSEVLNRRRGLSQPVAARIAKRLSLNETETRRFLALVAAEHGRSRVVRAQARDLLAAELDPSRADHQAQVLSYETFRMISDWYHQVLIELTFLKDFVSDADWIAAKLGISRIDAELAIERLVLLKQLEWRDGSLVAVDQHTVVPGGVPSDAIKGYHRQILAKADDALTFQSLDEREFGTTIVSIRPEKIPEAKEMLRKFRGDFAQFLDEGSSGVDGVKDRVYCIAMQFFRLDQDIQKQTSVVVT